MTAASPGTLTPPRWLVEEIASKAGGDSITPPAWDMRDDLAILGLGGLWEMAGVPADDGQWAEWSERFAAVISTEDTAWTQRMADHLIARPGHRGNDWDEMLIDPVTMEAIEAYGANPVAMALLTRLHEDVTLDPVSGPGGKPLFVVITVTDAIHDGNMKPFLTMSMDLGGVAWQGERVVLLSGDLPETLAIAIKGRPLHEVVSHPLLDRHDLSVVEWSAPSIIIRHGGEMRRLLDWTPNGRRR